MAQVKNSRQEASEAAKQEAERAGYTAIAVTYITALGVGQWVVGATATTRSGDTVELSISVSQSAAGSLAHIEQVIS